MWSPIARKAVFLTALVVLVRPVLLPAQEYVYTAAADADEVRGFRVDPVTGALTPVPGSPVTVDWPYAVPRRPDPALALRVGIERPAHALQRGHHDRQPGGGAADLAAPASRKARSHSTRRCRSST